MLRLGRLVCGRLLFALQILVLAGRLCLKNRFSPHRPATPTIFDCNNLPSVCSRLLPPFEPQRVNHPSTLGWLFSGSLFFVRIKRLALTVAARQCIKERNCFALCCPPFEPIAPNYIYTKNGNLTISRIAVFAALPYLFSNFQQIGY